MINIDNIYTPVQVTVSLQEQRPLLKALASHLYRVDAFECVGRENPKTKRRRKCDCFDCNPLNLEEACIRYLAGQPVDFKFIEA